MSNDISGPFKKISGPPYVYEVSFPENNPLFNGEHWYELLKKHAWASNTPCKSINTENGYKLAFLKSNDYERLLMVMEPEIKRRVKDATWYKDRLYERYGISNKDKVTPSPEKL